VLAGLLYVRTCPELGVPLLMMAIVGCLTSGFPVNMPHLARAQFGGDSRTFGFMTAAMALGAVAGGLYNEGRGNTGVGRLVRSSVGLGVLVLATALAPSAEVELVVLVGVGAASVMLMARGNATLQLGSDLPMRGRVMALWLVAFLGTTPVGRPAVGWVCSTFGARWGQVLGTAACFAAAGLGQQALERHRTAPVAARAPSASPCPRGPCRSRPASGRGSVGGPGVRARVGWRTRRPGAGRLADPASGRRRDSPRSHSQACAAAGRPVSPWRRARRP
jgi:hypothetical protein